MIFYPPPAQVGRLAVEQVERICAARVAARAAARVAARVAAGAIVVRDLISPNDYEILTAPWRSVFPDFDKETA